MILILCVTGTLAKLPRCRDSLQAAGARERVRALGVEDSDDATEVSYVRRLFGKLG